ncbi:MAG TPA: hypothetical protein DCM54_08290 [Gammaproteobacteria bacterium]|nr:hypothetical protein [Gammaproteobacteria bacterium]
MISDDISLDKLIADIDQQIEVLTAIAGDSAILQEQLRIHKESREALINQDLELARLAELLDQDNIPEFTTIIEASKDPSSE